MVTKHKKRIKEYVVLSDRICYDIPWIETELDPSFMREIEEFPNKNLPTIYALIDKYKDGKTVVVFKSREEAGAFLNGEKLCTNS